MGGESMGAGLFDVAIEGVGQAVGRFHLHVVVDLDEHLEPARLVEALRAVVEQNPILGARLRRSWWRYRWEPHPFDPAAVEVVEGAGDLEGATARIAATDLEPAEEPACKVWLLHDGGGARLVITLLHQVVDGAGALSVLRQLALRLARQEGEQPSRDRGFGQVVRSLRPSMIPALLAGCLRWSLRPLELPFLARTSLARPPASSTSSAPSYRVVEVDFSEGSPMRDLCRQVGCTVNDVLVAGVSRLVAELSERGALASFFTVDLRRYLRDRAPRLTNLAGVDVVVLPRSSARTLRGAMAAVAARTRRKKRGVAGLSSMLAPGWWSFLLPHAVVRGVGELVARWAAALLTRGLVVTNIGSMDDALEPLGDTVTGAHVVGPFARDVRVPIITATGFRDHLTLQVGGWDSVAEDELDRVAGLLGEALTPPRGV